MGILVQIHTCHVFVDRVDGHGDCDPVSLASLLASWMLRLLCLTAAIGYAPLADDLFTCDAEGGEVRSNAASESPFGFSSGDRSL